MQMDLNLLAVVYTVYLFYFNLIAIEMIDKVHTFILNCEKLYKHDKKNIDKLAQTSDNARKKKNQTIPSNPSKQRANSGS